MLSKQKSKNIAYRLISKGIDGNATGEVSKSSFFHAADPIEDTVSHSNHLSYCDYALEIKYNVIEENKRYSKEYLEADKRSIANAVVIYFKDGSSTQRVEVEYPIGHRRRREQGIPLLIEKFERNLRTQFSEDRSKVILDLCANQEVLESTSVPDFMELMIAE